VDDSKKYLSKLFQLFLDDLPSRHDLHAHCYKHDRVCGVCKSLPLEIAQGLRGCVAGTTCADLGVRVSCIRFVRALCSVRAASGACHVCVRTLCCVQGLRSMCSASWVWWFAFGSLRRCLARLASPSLRSMPVCGPLDLCCLGHPSLLETASMF